MTPHVAAWLFPAWVVTVILAGVVGMWIAWPVAFDRGFEEAVGPKERHRHRIGDPQQTTLLELPRAGQLALEPLPEPERAFLGAQVQPRPGPAEYELMTRPHGQAPPAEPDPATIRMGVTRTSVEVEVSGDPRRDETPSAWTRRQAVAMDEFIKGMVEESNYFQHTILADHLSARGGPEDGAR